MARKRSPKRTPARRLSSAKKGTLRLALVLGVLVVINLYVFLWRDSTSIPEVKHKAAMAGERGPAAVDSDQSAEQPVVFDENGEPVDPGGPLPEQAEEDGSWSEGQVQKGDSLGRILTREKLGPEDRVGVIRALRKHMDFRKIRAGQSYRVHHDDDGKVETFEFDITITQKVRARRGVDGTFNGEKLEAETEIRVKEVGGRVATSLYQAMKDAGEDTKLVGFFVDVFAYDLNFYVDTHKNDTFRILVEKEYLNGEFLRYRRVVGAEYDGKAGKFHAFEWKAPGSDTWRYYDEDGQSVERTLLKTPLKFSRITSGYGVRTHPKLHTRQAHMGVDYAAATGTPIWAAAPGRIKKRGWMGGAGNCVILEHADGMETVYMHMSKFRKGQEVGDRVSAKTVIGYVGSTGMSTGAHLHFGVKINNRYVNPLKLKIKRSVGVPAKHRDQFKQETVAVVERLKTIQLPPPVGESAGDDVDAGAGEAVPQESTEPTE